MKLPPLKVFMGCTPMKEWINNCKPFKPTVKSKPKIEFIDIAPSTTFLKYIEAIELTHELFKLHCNEILGIQKQREGNSK